MSERIGFGTYPLKNDDAVKAVISAIEVGYRLIDTAAKYENEEAVGRGIRDSGVDREDVIIQTKLRGANQHIPHIGLEESLQKLGVEYLDRYLIHWPLPMIGEFVHAWEYLVEAREKGLVREIGVSNFELEHLDAIEHATGVRPVVNQIKSDPQVARPEFRQALMDRGIIVEAWRPIGRGGELLEIPEIVSVAEGRGWSPARTVLAWHGTVGNAPIVRSSNRDRQAENLAAVEARLTEDELAVLARIPQLELDHYDPHTHDER